MNVSVDEARSLLRALDPAGSLDSATPEELDAALGKIMEADGAVVVGVLGEHEVRPRRRLTLPLVAASVLLILGVAAGVVETRSHSSARRSLPNISTPNPARRSADMPTYLSYSEAKAIVDARFAALSALPGAVRTAKAPTKDLAEQYWVIAPGILYVRTTFYRAPGAVPAAAAYLRAHAPEGTTLSGSGSSPTSQEVDFETPNGSGAQYFFEIVPFGNGVAVRADVAALWHPAKPAAETLGHVDKVAVSLTVPGSNSDPQSLGNPNHSYGRWLYGSEAQTLADEMDSYPVQGGGIMSCPPGPGIQFVLSFYSGARAIVMKGFEGCGDPIAVTVDGRAEPTLIGNPIPELRAIFGLPSN